MGIEEILLDSAKKEGIRQTALKMRESGLDVLLIAQITGLTTEEIKQHRVTELSTCCLIQITPSLYQCAVQNGDGYTEVD